MSIEIQEIEIGQRVKSYDFPMHLEYEDTERAELCFMEGTVQDIVNGCFDGERFVSFECPRYQILVDRQVFNGEEVDLGDETAHIYPPVNGTAQMFSDHKTHGVRKVA